jgi:hypothetical protein
MVAIPPIKDRSLTHLIVDNSSKNLTITAMPTIIKKIPTMGPIIGFSNGANSKYIIGIFNISFYSHLLTSVQNKLFKEAPIR